MDKEAEVVEEEDAEWLRLINPLLSHPSTTGTSSLPTPFIRLASAQPSTSPLLRNTKHLRCCLWALSNVWGVGVVGDGSSEIRLFSLSNLRALLRTPSPTPPTPIAKLTLPPNSRPVWIRFAMGDKKIVVGWVQNGGQDVEEGMGTVGVWSLKKVLEGDLSTLHELPSLPLSIDLLPNPSLQGGLPHLVLAVGKRELVVLSLKDGEEGVVGRMEGGWSAVAWSAKGKQFILANAQTGTLDQFSPSDLINKKATIPFRTSAVLDKFGDEARVSSVGWLENDLFLVTIAGEKGGGKSKVGQYLIQRNGKVDPPTFEYKEIDEYFMSGFNDARAGSYRSIANVRNWGESKHLVFVISDATPDVGVLRCKSSAGDNGAGEWSQLSLDEDARASLPFQQPSPDSVTEPEETVPLGIEIDYTATDTIKMGMLGGVAVPDLPPMPRLLVYSNDGVLMSYEIRNTEAGKYDGMMVTRDIKLEMEESMDDGMQLGTRPGTPAEMVVRSTSTGPSTATTTPPQPLAFGMAAAGAKPSFGFGGAKIPTIGAGFGASTNMFAAAQNKAAITAAAPAFGASAFGSKATTAAFGSTVGPGAATSAFGSSGFGTNKPAVTSAFGGSGGSAFGQGAFGASATSSTTSAFGGAKPSAFGAPANSTSTANPFGGSGTTPTATVNPFGAAPSTGAFGAKSAFGQPTTSSAFGSSSFGQQGPGFGQTAAPKTAFGAAPPSTPFGSSAFGSSSTSPAAAPPKPSSSFGFAARDTKQTGDVFGGMNSLGDMLGGSSSAPVEDETTSPIMKPATNTEAGSESPDVEKMPSPLFKQPPLFSGFGGASSTSGSARPSAFGQTAEKPSPATGAFGGASSGAFGGLSTSSGAFGQPAAPTVKSAFGTAPAASPSATEAPKSSIFGAPSFGGSSFGKNVPIGDVKPSLFGSSSFGQPSSSTDTSQASKPAAAVAAPASGGFGTFSKGGFGGFATASTSKPAETSTPAAASTAKPPSFGFAPTVPAEEKAPPPAIGAAPATSEEAKEPRLVTATRTSPPVVAEVDQSVDTPPSPPAEPEPEASPAGSDRSEDYDEDDYESEISAEGYEIDELPEEEQEPASVVAPKPASKPNTQSAPTQQPVDASVSASTFSSSAEGSRESQEDLEDEEETELKEPVRPTPLPAKSPATPSLPQMSNPFAPVSRPGASIATPPANPTAAPLKVELPKQNPFSFRQPTSAPNRSSPLASGSIVFPPTQTPPWKGSAKVDKSDPTAAGSSRLSSRPADSPPVPTIPEQTTTPKRRQDSTRIGSTRQQVTETGLAGQFVKTHLSLQHELDKLHAIALENEHHHATTAGPIAKEETRLEDILAAEFWYFDRLESLIVHGKQLELKAAESGEEGSDLDGRSQSLIDSMERVHILLVDCERRTKIKGSSTMNRSLKVRKLGPMQEKAQADLRNLNKQIADKVDEIDGALSRLRKRISRQRTGQIPVRSSAWHSTQSTIRDTTAKIRDHQLNIDDLSARIERVVAVSSSKEADAVIEEEHPEPLDANVRASGALNAERIGFLLQQLNKRAESRIIECSPGQAKIKISAAGEVVVGTQQRVTNVAPASTTSSGFAFGIAPIATTGLRGIGLGKAPGKRAERGVHAKAATSPVSAGFNLFSSQ